MINFPEAGFHYIAKDIPTGKIIYVRWQWKHLKTGASSGGRVEIEFRAHWL